MAYLFDTDAISELFKLRPAPDYLEWLASVDREDQFTSAVVLGELYKGAFRSQARDRHLRNIEERVLPGVTVLPFDLPVARLFGQLLAELQDQGTPLADADAQIGSTALHFGLTLVTGNLRHFERIPHLRISKILSNARRLHKADRRGDEMTRVYIASRDSPPAGSVVWIAIHWPETRDFGFRQATYLGDGSWQLDEGQVWDSMEAWPIKHWSRSREALVAQLGGEGNNPE